jgi:hypothetical protein
LQKRISLKKEVHLLFFGLDPSIENVGAQFVANTQSHRFNIWIGAMLELQHEILLNIGCVMRNKLFRVMTIFILYG